MSKKRSDETSMEPVESTNGGEHTSSNPKREAVRQAIEALGEDAPIQEMANYIRDHLNVEIENKVIGVLRHHLLRGKKKKVGRPLGSTKKVSKSSGEITFEDILAVKSLVRRLGAQRIHEMIDLFS